MNTAERQKTLEQENSFIVFQQEDQHLLGGG